MRPYDGAGNATLITHKERFHDATATGELQDRSTNPKARVTYVGQYFDAANRITSVVDVGTNAGASYTRPGSAPSASDTVLVNSYAYNLAGWPAQQTDPRGLKSKWVYDNAGRVKQTTETYSGSTLESSGSDPSPAAGSDRITKYTYDGMDHVLLMRAELPSSAFQETKYVYAATTGGGSDFAGNDVLTEVWYPNKSTGSASSSEKDAIKRNALGEAKQFTDRNGNVHDYAYDVAGRFTEDYVSTLGSGVQGSVRRLNYAYDSAGRLEKATSKSSPASGSIVVNEVQRVYNGLGQLTTEYQEHGGAVNTGASEKVVYTYSEMLGGANHSRLTHITSPVTGMNVWYEYDSGTDANISRVSDIAEGSSTLSGGALEEYTYLGVNTIVKRNRPEPNTALTYIGGSNTASDSSDWYTGFDRLGRVIDQRWDDGDNTADLDRFQYGYDRNSNVVYKLNSLSAGHSELYSGDSVDGNSAYDSLDRLVKFQRGTLSDSNGGSGLAYDKVDSESRYQNWTISALGNWDTLASNAGTETRSHNSQNQITTSPITHDSNGNMTKLVTGSNTYRYDAWNRMVEFGAGTPASRNDYPADALHRRVKEDAFNNSPENQTPPPGTDIHRNDLYYDNRWRVIAEQYHKEINEGATTDISVSNVWGIGYVDEMILRDRMVAVDDPENGVTTSSTRLYVQQDANFNVTSLTDADGVVQQRFVYDPYGKQTVLAGNWSATTDAYAWVYLHQGGRYNAVTNLYHFRFRDYSADAGRWMSQDPAGYVDGASLYQGLVSNPIRYLDPSGRSVIILPLPIPPVTSYDGSHLSPDWNAPDKTPSGGDYNCHGHTFHGDNKADTDASDDLQGYEPVNGDVREGDIYVIERLDVDKANGARRYPHTGKVTRVKDGKADQISSKLGDDDAMLHHPYDPEILGFYRSLYGQGMIWIWIARPKE